ncbi:MAG: hypothetical protein ISS48_03585 [Candidatus Aenigmarchaeota archaeon]|nr:hypothetical protein [Candidatus Aenigmarchaeota archaeon]
MKKLVCGLVAGLTLLASTSFAKDIQTFVHQTDGIAQVANKEALKGNYAGDTFFNYRQVGDRWIVDYITYTGKGRFLREFITRLDFAEQIPTYLEGIYSLYYDPDENEEDLVAVFHDDVDSKVKDAWIELAKKHIEMLSERY